MKIYLDSCVLLSHINNDDGHHQKAKDILNHYKNLKAEIYTAESFIKEFLFLREKDAFDSMTIEQKKEGLKKAREILCDIFSNVVIPLQENRKICFLFQEIIIACNLSKEEIKRFIYDINHLAHCIAYECTKFITFDIKFKNFLIKRSFDLAQFNVEILTDKPDLYSNKFLTKQILFTATPPEKETTVN
jgi:predicted nucleic acid-binding protein